MRGEVFTIGYAGIKLPHFIDILKNNNIEVLIDVRSVPRSQYFSQFNDTNLSKILPKHNIRYLNFKNEFGARQENLDFYTGGILDYEIFAASPQFQSGVEKVEELLSGGQNICLMCAEIDPINCHRAILCGKELHANGLAVKHIIAKRDGTILNEDQKGLENRLLRLGTTYKKQNLKIGNKIP